MCVEGICAYWAERNVKSFNKIFVCNAGFEYRRFSVWKLQQCQNGLNAISIYILGYCKCSDEIWHNWHRNFCNIYLHVSYGTWTRFFVHNIRKSFQCCLLHPPVMVVILNWLDSINDGKASANFQFVWKISGRKVVVSKTTCEFLKKFS